MRRLALFLVALLCLGINFTASLADDNDKRDNDLTTAQVIGKRAARHASKLADTLWSERAFGVVSSLSTDVQTYATASKRLFSSLAPTAADRATAYRSLQRVSHFVRSTADDALNKIGHLREAYEKGGDSGIRNFFERFASADVYTYIAAGERFFGSLAPTAAAHRFAARRSLRRGSRFIKRTALGAMNEFGHLREVYEKDGVPGIRNFLERFAAVDVYAYVVASKRLFISLVPAAVDRSAVRRSLQRASDFIRKTAVSAMNGIELLREAYEKDGFPGIQDIFEHFASADVHAYFAASKRLFDSLVPAAASRTLRCVFYFTKKIGVGAMNGIEHLRVAYEKDGFSGVRNSVERIASVLLDRFLAFLNTFAPSPEVPLLKLACNIDAIPLSSNKPWMFAFPIVFLLIGLLTWNILDKTKQPVHRAPSQNAPPSVTFDGNNENQSLQDEDGEPSTESENVENNDNEQEENRGEEGHTTRVLTNQYYEHKYGSESSTNSDSTYKSAGLPKDVTIRYGT